MALYWKANTLSRAGKEILIRSVAQTIPTYAMSCFLLPTGLIRELEQLMNNFLWGGQSADKHYNWMNWKKLCRSKHEGGLGFRDLEMFNLSLLARQGWRLITNPSSLAAQILKARYYPNSNFWEAPLGFSPSYCWRSLMRARDVLTAGSLWQVGNGSSLNVWQDRWIPRPSTFRPLGNFVGASADLKVCDFIDWQTKSWMEERVREVFLQDDAETILRIHLVDPLLPDKLVWYYTNDGKFSVKSAYKLLDSKQKSENGGGESTDATSKSLLWKKIWKLKVPPRIRSFLWRSSQEILPCKANLCRRHILMEPWCEFCGQEETTLHALSQCILPSQAWDHFPDLAYAAEQSRSFLDWAEQVLTLPEYEQRIWAVICSRLWQARNQAIFSQEFTDVGDLLHTSQELLEDVDKVKDIPIASPTVNITQEQRWSKPQAGWIKVNVDAAVKNDDCGIGIIGRADNGDVLFAGAKRIQTGTTVAVAEAEATLWGLQMASELGFDRVCLESDSLLLIKLVEEGDLPNTVFRDVLALAIEHSASFLHCKWNFCRREANKAADWLSRWQPLQPFFVSSNVYFPLEFYDVLNYDLG